MFFSPHPGKVLTRARPPLPTLAVSSLEPPLEPVVTVTTTFRLPPHLAFEELIREAAERYEVDPALVRAVVRIESAFNPLAVSTAGALGLMQLMPALAEELGVTDPFDPRQNVFAGVKYLRALLDEHDGNERLALASYNAGPGAVAHFEGIPPYPETQHYVRAITGILARERGTAATAAAAEEPR
jgi:soluble lytic murein transglycosylase-like protein